MSRSPGGSALSSQQRGEGKRKGEELRALTAPWVLPIAAPPLREGAVVVDADDVILWVGPRADLDRSLPEERTEGVLLPGLVNAHTHLELSHLTGQVPGGGGVPRWTTELVRRNRPATGSGAAAVDAAQAAVGATRAAVDAAQAAVALGTAAFGDVGNTTVALGALDSAGVPALFFHELLGSRDARTGDALADAAREREAHAREHGSSPRVAAVPAPHAPYSVGPDLFRRIFASAARTGRPTSVHVAEGEDELALLRDGSGAWAAILDALGVPPGSRTPGVSPVAYLASLGAFDHPSPPLLVHMVHATAEDRALARRHAAPVVLCPRSNLHIGGRLPDVRALLADEVSLAIGTDSLASTPDLSLWAELATLAAAFPDVPPATWLHAAIAGGAAALGLSPLGALAPGKRPGVLAVTIDDLAAPLESLVRNPEPPLRWMARP
jgi:cytosine/adenosine deaminase-related metal-dependent hydrolase